MKKYQVYHETMGGEIPLGTLSVTEEGKSLWITDSSQKLKAPNILLSFGLFGVQENEWQEIPYGIEALLLKAERAGVSKDFHDHGRHLTFRKIS